MTQVHKTKAISVACIGGGLEIYDFTIYIFFAPVIASLFFPKNNSLIPLLDTFIIFAVGYFARPLGAILFGHYGDTLGRKKGLLITILLMGLSTTLIGLLPTYSSIGMLAPLLLVILRFTQGLAVGGDLPGAITFVAEYADNHKRGLLCSLLYCGVNLGLLMASAIGAIITLSLSYEQLMGWGWRIPFILGITIAMIGFYLRLRITDTPYFLKLQETQTINKMPLFKLLREHSLTVLQSIGLVWLFAMIISQIFLYMPTYLHTESHLSLTTALIINSINLLIFSLCIPLFGYLSDKIGRKPIILITALLFCLFSYPLYSLLVNSNFIVQLIGLFAFGIFSAGIVGTIPSTLAEMFTTEVRYSGVGVAYGIGFAVFASLAPISSTYLLYKLQHAEAPSYNLILAAVVMIISALTIKNISRTSLDD